MGDMKTETGCYCVLVHICVELGVGVEGEKGVVEETCIYVRDSWGYAK